MSSTAETRPRLTPLEQARRGVGVGGPGAARTRRRRGGRRRAVTLLLLIVPSAFLLVAIHGYPLVYAAIQATHNGNLLQVGQFVGLQNFANVLSNPALWRAALFTLIFTVSGVFGSWVIGLSLALLLRRRVAIRGFFRTLLLLPWVVPVVVSTTAWNWLVATPNSPVPLLFKGLGWGTPLFLADPTLAAITVCLFKVWVSFPFMMLMASSALASVDASLDEAARVDGASSRQILFQITLPMIAKSTYVSWILMAIFCINDFPSVFLLTAGGPVGSTTTLVVYAYQAVFANFQTGPGVAVAFLMTLLSIVIALVLYRQIRRSSTP